MKRGYRKTYRKMRSIYKNVELDRHGFPKPLLILIICAAAFVAVFFTVRGIANYIKNAQKPVLTSEIMSLEAKECAAKIYMKTKKGNIFNELSGTSAEGFSKDDSGTAIVPLSDDMLQEISISLPREEIKELSYQVRYIETGELIEESIAEDFKENGDRTDVILHLKNLLSDKREYNLQLKLEMQDAPAMLYNTRIEKMGDVWADEKIEFVKNLTSEIYNQEKSTQVFEKLFPRSVSDGTNFAVANYNSMTSHVMWEGLSAHMLREPIPSIIKVDEESTKLVQSYPIEYKRTDGRSGRVIVNEAFAVRMGADGEVSALNYDRKASETLQEPAMDENGFSFGFQADADVQVIYDEGEKNIAFVNGGNVWLAHPGENGEKSSFTKIYSILSENDIVYDETPYIEADKDGNIKNIHGTYGIKLLSTDSSGNVKFLIYGTRPGGMRAGETGVSVYSYTNDDKKLEEILFIKAQETYSRLRERSDESFLNGNNTFFTINDGELLKVNKEELTTEKVSGNKGAYYSISSDGKCFACSSEKNGATEYIDIYSCDEEKGGIIQAQDSKALFLIGHVGSDIAYGKTLKDKNSEDEIFVNEIVLADSNGNEIISYGEEGLYYSDLSADENGVKYTTYIKKEDGSFEKKDTGKLVAREDKNHKKIYEDFVTEQGVRKQLKLFIEGGPFNTDITDTNIINESIYTAGGVVSLP